MQYVTLSKENKIEVKRWNIFLLLDDISSVNPTSRRNRGARLI